MVLALLADIHSNLEALQGCLAHAHARGATRFAFLGDLVGYGPDPGAVVDIVAQYASRGAVVVQGNHDAAACGAVSYLNDAAARSIEWSRGVLSPAQSGFLGALPLCVREEAVCFVHASAVAPDRWEYIDSPAAAQRSAGAAGTAYTFCGHVHVPELFGQVAGDRMIAFKPRPGIAIPAGMNRAWLAIVGSVGQPRDGNPAACYALVDLEAKHITFYRVAYDHLATARKVRAAGLPESLAYRLERGA